MRRHRSPAVAFFLAAVLIILGVCEIVKLHKLETVCTKSATGIVYDVRRGGRRGYRAWVNYQAEGKSHKVYIQSRSLITAGSRVKVLYDEKVPSTSYSPDYPPSSGFLSMSLGVVLAAYGALCAVFKKRLEKEKQA